MVSTVLITGAALLGVPAAQAVQPVTAPAAPASASGWKDLFDQLDLDGPAAPGPVTAATGADALKVARRVLSGRAAQGDPSATLALRDLWASRHALRGEQKKAAARLLARPTDGPADPQESGYTVREAAPVCNVRLCIHYVTSTADAPPSMDWVNYNLAVMDQTWTGIVDTLGYRAPITDGLAGGDGRFDVYLKDLPPGYYGYCATESAATARTASGYCVLDNDYNTTQFPYNTPDGNLRVTAAHEFFHAVQYAYDWNEDPWMMESTATWMEERLATDVDDNRQYLPASQVYQPRMPLDLFQPGEPYQYANWIFWEYLSTKYGVGVVNQVWQQAGTLAGDGNKTSVRAIDKVLRRKGGFAKNYARFASANLVPGRFYPEGSAYPTPRTSATKSLGKGGKAHGTTRLDHLTSASVKVRPKGALKAKKWKLRVQVNGPAKATSPVVVVMVHKKNGKVVQQLMKLNKRGDGSLRVPFSKRKVSAVSVTMANASTRYRCGRRTYLVCQGVPRDDRQKYSIQVRVVH